MSNKDFKIQESISGQKKSKIQRYMDLVIGSSKYSDLIKYELIVLLFSRIPGALGVYLRGKFYPILFKEVGRGVIFGSNMVMRHPQKISLGDSVTIDDNVLLDAKGKDNKGITLKDEVFIGRNTILSCKGGDIYLDDRVNIGFNCELFSSNSVKLGKDILVAAYTYIVGGGNYKLDDINTPINQQPDFKGKGGVLFEDNIWVGSHCVILDGVIVGSGSVIAAGAVVSKDVPQMSIVGGIPAKVLKSRLK